MLKPEEEGGDTKLQSRRAKDCWQPHRQEKAGKDPPLEPSAESTALLTLIPNFYLNLRE